MKAKPKARLPPSTVFSKSEWSARGIVDSQASSRVAADMEKPNADFIKAHVSRGF
jgi:hypothetical protein